MRTALKMEQYAGLQKCEHCESLTEHTRTVWLDCDIETEECFTCGTCDNEEFTSKQYDDWDDEHERNDCLA